MTPLLSIVIANFNYGRFLEDAIRSVLSQSCMEFELIIVDGGSTDNSVEIIKKYEDRLAWWCSEKDHGQSHAFNKGFARAKGRFLTWLNADDLLCPCVVEELARQWRKHQDCEWFTGNFYRFLNETGVICKIGWGGHYYPQFLQRKNSPIAVFGPSSFFSRELLARAGGVDESFHLMMDSELWMRFITEGIVQRRLNVFAYAFRMHESSKTAEFGEHVLSSETQGRFQDEGRRAQRKNGYVANSWLYRAFLLWRLLDGSLVMWLLLDAWYIGRNHGCLYTRNVEFDRGGMTINGQKPSAGIGEG